MKEQQQEKEKEDKARRINELKRQLEELEQAANPGNEEMQGDDQEYEEEHEEGNWEDDQDQPEPWTWTEQEEEKGTSKESSYILIDSAKDSPKDKSSTTQGKVAAGTSPKPKEADKDPNSEDFTAKALQMLTANHKQTLEVLMGNNNGVLTEEE